MPDKQRNELLLRITQAFRKLQHNKEMKKFRDILIAFYLKDRS
jgi:hypothetical protein